MKIFHIIVGLNVGGAETMLRRLVESDPAALPSTVVVSLTSLGVIGESLRAQGVTVHALGMASGWDTPKILWGLVKQIRRDQPDIIQTWMYHADLLGGLAARLAGNRNVVWGIRITSVPANNALTVFIMKVCSFLSRWIPKKIICVAEAARQVHIQYGYEPSRMTVISNGFDFSCLTSSPERRATLRRACGFSSSDLVVGCVGRYHPDKGQDHFIKAAALAVRRHPALSFLLIGKGCDPRNVKLMKCLREHNLEDHFVMLGERNDVPDCLSAMDVFCMPSLNEGFPNALGEAMAMGLPCVSTNVGDAAVLTGDTVILVQPQDEHALAEGLLEVAALPEEKRFQMGQRAQKRVKAEFSIEKARERFEAVYREILSAGTK